MRYFRRKISTHLLPTLLMVMPPALFEKISAQLVAQCIAERYLQGKMILGLILSRPTNLADFGIENSVSVFDLILSVACGTGEPKIRPTIHARRRAVTRREEQEDFILLTWLSNDSKKYLEP